LEVKKLLFDGKETESTKRAIYNTTTWHYSSSQLNLWAVSLNMRNKSPMDCSLEQRLTVPPIQNDSDALPVPEMPDVAWVFLSCLNRYSTSHKKPERS